MKFRKKPVVIEAVRWDGTNRNWIDYWMGSAEHRFDDDNSLRIETLEGIMRADIGDRIIKGIKGEFYPCKPDIFETTYDKESEE